MDRRLGSATEMFNRLFPMRHSPRPPFGSHIIPLDALLVAGRERRQIEQAIRKIVRNVHFEFLERECAFRLLGPDMYYHALDPHLPAALARFDPPVAVDDIVSYRSQGDLFDLCLEDSWSGWLIAEQLRRAPQTEDLVIIHLDDHTDMMSTLLECTDEGGLIEPSSRRRFDPEEPTSWETAILCGSIGIGCFITPFYWGARCYTRAAPEQCRRLDPPLRRHPETLPLRAHSEKTFRCRQFHRRECRGRRRIIYGRLSL